MAPVLHNLAGRQPRRGAGASGKTGAVSECRPARNHPWWKGLNHDEKHGLGAILREAERFYGARHGWSRGGLPRVTIRI
jgi:hypothetical protein